MKVGRTSTEVFTLSRQFKTAVGRACLRQVAAYNMGGGGSHGNNWRVTHEIAPHSPSSPRWGAEIYDAVAHEHFTSLPPCTLSTADRSFRGLQSRGNTKKTERRQEKTRPVVHPEKARVHLKELSFYRLSDKLQVEVMIYFHQQTPPPLPRVLGPLVLSNNAHRCV